ncbi:hypothetical protein AYL99_11874 [Fonsecaea erecta]|uniref:Glutaminase A central domain-containing protein n=1 Tax=Fonsecaea erecta TaxID=1367422 RepID=A0A178Z222_9EURO|nr:hypothetical protein AYL99_11874 [Fonsecaea erecta]OAP53852.1 hypothetical protein AYL99_11874 [Fonsecaea erecta]
MFLLTWLWPGKRSVEDEGNEVKQGKIAIGVRSSQIIYIPGLKGSSKPANSVPVTEQWQSKKSRAVGILFAKDSPSERKMRNENQTAEDVSGASTPAPLAVPMKVEISERESIAIGGITKLALIAADFGLGDFCAMVGDSEWLLPALKGPLKHYTVEQLQAVFTAPDPDAWPTAPLHTQLPDMHRIGDSLYGCDVLLSTCEHSHRIPASSRSPRAGQAEKVNPELPDDDEDEFSSGFEDEAQKPQLRWRWSERMELWHHRPCSDSHTPVQAPDRVSGSIPCAGHGGRAGTLASYSTAGRSELRALLPHNQLSTDDFAGWLVLQTNVALKGILGIKAIAGLAELTENYADAKCDWRCRLIFHRKRDTLSPRTALVNEMGYNHQDIPNAGRDQLNASCWGESWKGPDPAPLLARKSTRRLERP